MYQEIHKAAAEGDVDTIRRLLKDGVDPSIKNTTGSQPTLALPPSPQGDSRNDPLQMRSIIKPDPIEPSYQTVDTPKQHSTNQNRPPISIQPIGMYAEIGIPPDTQRRPSDPLLPRPDSHSQSDSQTKSEPRSSPMDNVASTQGEVNNDNPSTGLAVYAQVDMEKKRASRKQKQQQDRYREEIFIGGQQKLHPPRSQPEDSWV